MGILIGLLAVFGLIILCLIIHKAANHMRDLSQGRTGPDGDVSTEELERRYAELNRHWHVLPDEQRREHDKIRDTLLMRGKNPFRL